VTFDRVPSTLSSYEVPGRVLEDTGSFLQERGSEGVEAVVLWIGRALDEEQAAILAAYAPDQVAYRSEHGLAVEVTAAGLTELISALPAGVFVLCRVHSHPGAAYHSELDDQNLIIAHPGAISIVVPFFARDPIVLDNCSVNELRHGAGWRQLSPDETRDRFTIR
jgi:hypothetical protein